MFTANSSSPSARQQSGDYKKLTAEKSELFGEKVRIWWISKGFRWVDIQLNLVEHQFTLHIEKKTLALIIIKSVSIQKA